MRFKVAEQEDTKKGFDIHARSSAPKVEERMKNLGVTVLAREMRRNMLSLPHPI